MTANFRWDCAAVPPAPNGYPRRGRKTAHSIWTFAPCCQAATYWSRAELYVTISWDGKERLNPYVVVSLPVWIECP